MIQEQGQSRHLNGHGSDGGCNRCHGRNCKEGVPEEQCQQPKEDREKNKPGEVALAEHYNSDRAERDSDQDQDCRQ